MKNSVCVVALTIIIKYFTGGIYEFVVRWHCFNWPFEGNLVTVSLAVTWNGSGYKRTINSQLCV